MEPIIELRGVSKTYDTPTGPVHALRDVSLRIERGERYGIIGMSGAGKTTLVRCINLLERPTSGEVRALGRSLTAMSARELNQARRSISMIFQHFNLFAQRTIERNVSFPLERAGVPREQARAKALDLLDRFGLRDRAQAYPSQLSGGQKQRVAIARALATDPQVLLCDEATSALDPMTTRDILGVLRELGEERGLTIAIITHEMSVIRELCTRVAVMDGSRVVEEGPVHELFTHPQTQATRRLFLADGIALPDVEGIGSAHRLTFDGSQAFEPIVSGLTLACGAHVNILFANIERIEGRPMGQMIVRLPSEPEAEARARRYLEQTGIHCEEVIA